MVPSKDGAVRNTDKSALILNTMSAFSDTVMANFAMPLQTVFDGIFVPLHACRLIDL